MKWINKNNLLLLDFWFVVGIIVFDFVVIMGRWTNFINIDSHIFVYIYYVVNYINILFIIICFAKSITGIILLLKSVIKKDKYITENILKSLPFFSFFFLLSILLLIYYIYEYVDYFVDYFPNDHYNNKDSFFFSIQISLIHLMRFAIINTLINIFGIPLWFSWYMYSNKSINNKMKIIANIITQIMIILTYGLIFIDIIIFGIGP